MNKAKYSELFVAFRKVPMKEFLELLFEGVPVELKDRLIIQDVSYHRLSPEIVTLEAWMDIDSPKSDKWIWAQVELDTASGDVKESYFTKDSYGKESLSSLKACLDCYRKTEK